MVRTGKVMSVDSQGQSGVIREGKKDFFFHVKDCKAGSIPPLHATVFFEKDEDFSTLVAIEVVVDQLPRRI